MATKQSNIKRINIENREFIQKEIDWLSSIISCRINSYFSENKITYTDKPPQSLENNSCYYAQFLKKYTLTNEERKILILALTPEIKPQLLDLFQTRNQMYDIPYSEFGGILNHGHAGFIPTIQTALFILSGNDTAKYLEYLELFDTTSKLFSKNILETTFIDNNDHFINTLLGLSKSALHYLLYGTDIRYEYSLNFPASLLTTGYTWEDLVLSPETEKQISELEIWIRHGDTLLDAWELDTKVKPGYRVLFHGPPGTGKTLTAALLGKQTGRDVYRIDLSQVLSKYIGETEKNLENIFKRAEQKDWILFFDEADSLFSHRTGIANSNDRHANQETSYLLQRIEECKNIIILASNLLQNIDKAFIRRFQAVIHFPVPDEKERLALWQKSKSSSSTLSDNINLAEIAAKYKLTGASIMNVIRYASLMALNRGSSVLEMDNIMTGIRRELYNEGKVV